MIIELLKGIMIEIYGIFPFFYGGQIWGEMKEPQRE
jgi:hypothetical protein